LNSTNNKTARQVINEIIAHHGKEEFYKAVHVVVADQDFMPTMLNAFLSRLTTDKQLPLTLSCNWTCDERAWCIHDAVLQIFL